MKSIMLVVAAVMATAAFSAPASAAVIASTGFESPQFPALGPGQDKYGPDGVTYNSPPSAPLVVADFTFTGYSGIFSNPPLCCTLATPYGNQFGFVQTYQDTDGLISWTVNGLTTGGKYALSFSDIGGTGPVGVNPLTVSFVGGTPLSSTTSTPSTTAWLSNVVDFTATAPSATITFAGNAVGSNLLSGIDNLVVSSVPEPATWATMLLGMFGIGALMRQARRRTVAAAA